MQVGDLVRQTRYGFENIVGVVVGRGFFSTGRLGEVRVLWGNTGKEGIYDVEKLEVICK